MAEVKWIKINVDMFDDEKIKIIQSMPEGDALLIVWIKLITLAGKTNDGGYVYIAENMPYTDEMLSVIMNKPLNTIRLALETFNKLGMVENDIKGIYLVNFEKHQSLDKLAEIREKNRLRVKKFREKQKQLECNVTETLCNDIDIDKELDIEIELDKDIDKENIYSSTKAEPNVPYQEITEYLNNKTGSSYRHSTKKTKDLIKARFNEGFTLEDFKTVIDKKSVEWMNTDMQKYLRPETLFGTKFESYLNQQVNNKAAGRKEMVPEWFNKNIEAGEMTKEQKEEMDNLFKEFDAPKLASPERIKEIKERLNIGD